MPYLSGVLTDLPRCLSSTQESCFDKTMNFAVGFGKTLRLLSSEYEVLFEKSPKKGKDGSKRKKKHSDHSPVHRPVFRTSAAYKIKTIRAFLFCRFGLSDLVSLAALNTFRYHNMRTL